MKELREDLKNDSYKRVYLLYGDERYLIKHYERKLKEKIVPEAFEAMNLSVYNGKDISAETIMDSAETLPFFNDHRLIIAKNTGFFSQGRKEEADKLSGYVGEIPESSVIIFVESEIDKRNGLYKKIVKSGRAVEFNTPSEKDLIKWIINYCKNQGKNMSVAVAVSLLRTVTNDMDNISSELDKLIAYRADESEIRSEDVPKVCNKSLEAKIFDLVAAIGNKNVSAALEIFNNMLQLKESPLMVLAMIARQFRMILLSKHLSEKGVSTEQIAEKLNIRSFIVRECIKQGRNFKTETLKNIFIKCLETDVKIKSGQMNDKLAVEMLILSI